MNFENAFWRSDVFDYKPFETWLEEGERDTEKISNLKVFDLLKYYEKPALDIAIEEELAEFVRKKKSDVPDAFV